MTYDIKIKWEPTATNDPLIQWIDIELSCLELRDDVTKWLNDTIGYENWYYALTINAAWGNSEELLKDDYFTIIFFDNRDDALLFMLVWR